MGKSPGSRRVSHKQQAAACRAANQTDFLVSSARWPANAKGEHVQQTILGRTGLKVGVAGLGAGGDSRLGLRQGEAHSRRLVHVALAQGVNFIDTAEAYGTEEVIGQ